MGDYRYQLNGNWQVDLFGSTVIGGAQWKYERKSFRAEKLFTTGPLLEDIIVEVKSYKSVELTFTIRNKPNSF